MKDELFAAKADRIKKEKEKKRKEKSIVGERKSKDLVKEERGHSDSVDDKSLETSMSDIRKKVLSDIKKGK